MDFTATLQTSRIMLAEGAITERLRRREDIVLHPTLFNTPLIYEQHGRHCLQEIYGQYREVARAAGFPVLLCAPTWRVDGKRTAAAGFSPSLNRDAVAFMRGVQAVCQDDRSPLFIGGLVGPANDCYRPSEALSASAAEAYHGWQIGELATAGVDVVIGQTFPAVSEALGVARACGAAGVGCLISFVLNRRGEVLDGTPIAEAVAAVDAGTAIQPVGYMVNCVYPTFLLPDKQPASLFQRLTGIQANASSLDHAQLDGSTLLRQDNLQEWGELMVGLNRDYGVKILGGCCGTDEKYLSYIAHELNAEGR